MSETVYLGLGSNLGDREGNIAKALRSLAQEMSIEQVSSIYETEPIGYREQPWFLNAVCRGLTSLDPFSLLHLIKEIEGELGRVTLFPDAPRIIDIDILFYGDEILATEDLTIPHPKITERLFVLVPLAEIAPELIHPVAKKPIKELVHEVQGSQQVNRWRWNVPGIGKATF